ncbi:uridine kinase family protein [Aeromicrobium camelliae]|uniref:uridine kinase family protein n=1 Tax=Aeromicrobium camelliae TaxID=1538144 RepID=UPI001FB80022|nr:ATP-binding protein [Aeromicrobium camelliae]
MLTPTRVVIVAGPSGAGKSHLARRLAWPVLRLDDFYREGHDPDLPMSPLGIPDWDDVRSWDAPAALEAIVALCAEGEADVPVYDLGLSRRTGMRRVSVPGQRFIAEGLFAPNIVGACRDAGVLGDAICLVRPRLLTFALRLARDLREARKPPSVLIRRGWQLLGAEGEVVARAVAAGCEPMSPRRAYARLAPQEPAR